ncbi:MAG: TrkH family potassium uptake protein [Proteobacteria bacterium]|nr:TrkH family potassium uptake protein [Pseudomonadota bacterium]MBU1640589.1 TrkH family potassium uptake protein [Pseudomonadota bacterium]
MRTGGVLNIIGKLLLLLSLFLLTPIPFSLYYQDGMVKMFLLCSVLGTMMGGSLLALFAPEDDLGYRDGFAVVVLSWLGLALLGSLPYFFCGAIPSFIDAFFESMSGFTTTGSTILNEVEILPQSVLFWRATTHWLGGMGIIVLSLAILPLLGVGGMQLFQAEMPGPTKDRLAPRIQDTARILWVVYVAFTLIQTVLMMLGGMTFFDALCHAFATLATGGFSTHTASAGYWQSGYLEYVIILFMLLAGVNFSLHYRAFAQRSLKPYLQNEEFRFYMIIVGVATVAIVIANMAHAVYSAFGNNLRDTLFQVVSMITTTGFGTADFDQWPSVTKVILVSLMFVGGCAGSTGGGIKVVRVLLFFKYARLQLRTLIHPRSVGAIKLGNQKVPKEVMISILGFFAIYIGVFFAASLLVTAMGVDLVTGMTSVIATLNNIGPGLAEVGPSRNFGDLPQAAKVVLSFCMLAGRLELYTVAVLLTPDFWKMARRPVWRWELAQKREGRLQK